MYRQWMMQERAASTGATISSQSHSQSIPHLPDDSKILPGMQSPRTSARSGRQLISAVSEPISGGQHPGDIGGADLAANAHPDEQHSCRAHCTPLCMLASLRHIMLR